MERYLVNRLLSLAGDCFNRIERGIPEIIEFPGKVELWERFWNEIPKPAFEVD